MAAPMGIDQASLQTVQALENFPSCQFPMEWFLLKRLNTVARLTFRELLNHNHGCSHGYWSSISPNNSSHKTMFILPCLFTLVVHSLRGNTLHRGDAGQIFRELLKPLPWLHPWKFVKLLPKQFRSLHIYPCFLFPMDPQWFMGH